MSNKPYWFPVLCDADYFSRLRADYPENAYMSDARLHDHYNEGLKYQNLWDHVGDAYSDYEPMADAFLVMYQALKTIASHDIGGTGQAQGVLQSIKNTAREALKMVEKE